MVIEYLKNYFGFGSNKDFSVDYHSLSTKTDRHEILSGKKDKNGFIYSRDGLRLLKGHSFIDKAKIKNSVLVICDNAFEYCFVENLQFPQNLKRIGTQSFSHARCKGNFILPNSLEMIDNEAFSNFTDESCNSNISFIPENVKVMGTGVFLKSKINRSVKFSNEINIVPQETFRGGHFETIQLSEHTKIIESYAFENCKISSIFKLSPKIESICEGAFQESDSIDELNLLHLKHLGHNSMSNCKRLKKVVFHKGFEHLGYNVFANCKSINLIDLSNSSIKEIPNACFEGCYRLENVKFPPTIVSIGKKAFANTKLQILDLSGCQRLVSIQEGAFASTNIFEVSFPENIQELGEGCFENCKQLEQLIGEINISLIPDSLFDNCEKLKTVKLGNNVSTIGTRAFHGCEALEEFVLPNSIQEIGDLAFCSCDHIKLTLPNRLETLGSQAFAWDWQLEEMVLPSSLKVIRGNPFCGLSIRLTNKSKNFMIKDNVLFCKDMTCLIYFGKECEEYNIPEPVRVIGNNAFSYNRKIKKIVLPYTVSKIESLAFYGCGSLTFINLNEDIEIEEEVFCGCSLLKKYGVKTNYPITEADIMDAYYDSMIDYDYF